MNAPEEKPDVRQYLVFSLAGESYALPLLDVKEIIEYGGVTAIPTVPGCIRGVINLRGRVVPVMDLAARFGEARSEINARTCIVILEQDGHDTGVVVDSVTAVVDIDPAAIEPPPSFGVHIRVDFIHGLWKFQDRFIVLLAPEQVLSVEEITRQVAAVQEQDDA